MFNWFDLMRQAQSSTGFGALARQFQLSDDQAQRAMMAFMPAFAMGLQQAMLAAPSNPFLRMFPNMGQNLWQNAGQASSPQSHQNGKWLLDQLFGSDEASRRIAHQAADFTGMSVELMQQMLPLFAGIFAGSLHQWMTSQGHVLEAFTPKANDKKRVRETKSATVTDPWTAFWTAWMQQSAPSGDKAGSQHEELTTSFLRTPPQPPSPPEKAAASPPWEDMMEKGHEMQMQYLTSLQSILNDAWKTGTAKH
ncbi:DUF937 domain-containing protein [Microvirga sp. 2TAF3]|uniref:DUF937 domain-containing protein n=1 Tax=Microvirga sp. 2TAF3 TaxID=3233014 RepID=UPI003F9C15EF